MHHYNLFIATDSYFDISYAFVKVRLYRPHISENKDRLYFYDNLGRCGSLFIIFHS